MTARTNIHELPDFPAIKQIQEALWRVGEIHGAAAFVGAGFSRNAILPSPNSAKPPLWGEFCHAMRQALYRDSQETNAPADPLRLAQEYRAVLGQSALENLIYELVRDNEWRPGPLHSRLVDLPWTDILTTNWDTLLERAAELTDREDTYDIVRTIGDIPRAHSPRIVKLHGSMPSNYPFIFTEEEYRSYPRTFAPFVNLVQQVLMENELCLLGFSGDDPNFVQWSGWIRDQLGDAARRIYLIGVLNLPGAYRKYLEARKVTPIDLTPLVEDLEGDDRHSQAASLFLEFLHSSKPKAAWDWRSEVQSTRSHQLLGLAVNKSNTSELTGDFLSLIEDLRKEHETYRRWLICPSGDRIRIRDEVANFEYVFRQVREHLSAPDESTALYEMSWRLDLVLLPMSEWFRGLLGERLENPSTPLTRQQRIEIGMILLRAAREERDRSSFDRWIAFLKERASSDADAIAWVGYEQSLWARDSLDYPSIATLVSTISGTDPAWKIRRASLHFDLGEFDEAVALLRQALKELRDLYLRDRKSIWIISRLSWALFILRAASRGFGQPKSDEPLIASNDWPDYFSRNKCLPWDELEHLDREIADEFQDRIEGMQQEQVGFEAGTYRKTVRLISSSGWAQHETKKLIDLVGVPMLAGNVDVMRSRLSRTLELATNYRDFELFQAIWASNGTSNKVIERAFSRIAVARMPFNTVSKLMDTLWRDIEFGRARFGLPKKVTQPAHGNFWVERVALMFDVLSRLVVRLSGEPAVEAFRRAVSLAHSSDLCYWALFEPLANLLTRTFTAIPPRDRGDFLIEILNFPLPDEKGIYGKGVRGPWDHWPEIMYAFPETIDLKRPDKPEFAARISTFITKLSGTDPLTRERAALRLTRLLRLGILTSEESISFGRAVWSDRESESTFPKNTNLNPHVFFEIPGADKDHKAKVFRIQVLDKALSGLADPDQLREIAAVCRLKKDGSRVFELSAEEALRLFDLIMAWQPRPVPTDLNDYNDKMSRQFGAALVEAILPVVDLKAIGSERIDRLVKRGEVGALHSGLLALPDIVRLNHRRKTKAIDLIRRSIFTQERDTVVYALSAIERWHSLSKLGSIGKLPRDLKQAVIAIITNTSEPWLSSAIHLAGKLLAEDDLSESDKKELVLTLDRLRTETAYSSWETSDKRTVNITHIRARCVTLAQILQKKGVTDEAVVSWIDGAKNDPVPEVRYALAEDSQD